MEIYEFSLKIPLPDAPFEKGKALSRIETLAGAMIAALARAKFDGVALDHGLVKKRGEYAQRKPRIVPPEPVCLTFMEAIEEEYAQCLKR